MIAPKCHLPTRASPNIPNPDPDIKAPRESIKESEPISNMTEIAQEMRDMRQTIGVMMEAINRQSPQYPAPVFVEPQVLVQLAPPSVGSSQT